MELTPKLNANVLDAIGEAIKGLNPRPAVDRVLTARLTGKWTHYAQVLLAYAPDSYGLAYVNLDKPSEPIVKIHDAQSKAGKAISGKEIRRIKKLEKALAAKIDRDTKATEPKAVKPVKAKRAEVKN